MNTAECIIRIKTCLKRTLRIMSMPILVPLTLMHRPKKTYGFPDTLSVVAIAKDEAPYIREWVEFYKVVGVSRIYLYDNGSTDGMRDRIADFIDSGFVVYTTFPGIARQYAAYMDAIARYKYQTRYMAFVDCDEFVMPCDLEKSLAEVVSALFDRYGKGVGGITVNWTVYGPSGHREQPDGLVLEEYLQREPNDYFPNACIKTIANPRAILKYQHAHYPIYYAGYRNVDVDGRRVDGAYDFSELNRDPHVLRLNHYYTKSYAEYLKRRSRRVADRQSPMIRPPEVLKRELAELDANTVYDDSGLVYAQRVKRLDARLHEDSTEERG